MASHLLPLTLSVTVVIDVRHAYIITLPALFINPSDYLTVTFNILNSSLWCLLNIVDFNDRQLFSPLTATRI